MYLKYFHTYPVLVRDIGFSILSGILPTDRVSPIPAAGSSFAADSSFVNMPTVLNYYTNHCTYIKFIKFTH
jgi:hypothetical protein